MDEVASKVSFEVLDAMKRYYVEENHEASQHLADRAWRLRDGGEPKAGDDLAELGEVWRMAMLAATRDGVSPARLVWRARALSAFVRSGCRNGAALLCLPSYFELTEDDRATPQQIIDVLDVMESLADDEGPESKSIVLSTCIEKRAYYRSLVAERALDPVTRSEGFAAAEADYRQAHSIEETDRRRAKIEAAMTSVAYLAATTDERRSAAQADLRSVLVWIQDQGIAAVDVVRIGEENIDRMTAGRRDLVPYEIT